MSEASLSTDLTIGAVIRTAAREGVSITVVRRGYASSGSIILKINRLDGTARVLVQTRLDDALAWIPATRDDPMDDKAADAYLEKQARIDPDAWLVEIEDKQGRIWFPGKVVV